MKRIEAVGGKKWREWCLLFLLGAATLLAFSKAVRHGEVLKAQASDLEFTASNRQGELDYAGAMSAREENRMRDRPLEYVNWMQTDGGQVYAPGLGTAEECSILLLLGRSDLLFPGYAVLDVDSRYGCLLSSALSGRLFGGKDTEGLAVEVQGRELEVLDVIDSEEVFLVCEAEENDLCSFDRASVNCISGDIGKTEESYQQLCGGWERMETRVPVWVAQGAWFLVPCILWIFLLCYCREMSRRGRQRNQASNKQSNRPVGQRYQASNRQSNRPVGQRKQAYGQPRQAGRWSGKAAGRMDRADRIENIIWVSMLYLLLAGGILLVVRKVRIPEDMIPTKWSDFNFWTEYGKKLGASCRMLVRSGKKIPDIPAIKEFVKTLQWAAAAVAGEVLFLCRFQKI